MFLRHVTGFVQMGHICQYVDCVIKRTPLPSSSLTPSSQPEASRMHPMPRNPASNCGTQYRPQSHFSRWSPPSSVLWCRTCAGYATSVESSAVNKTKRTNCHYLQYSRTPLLRPPSKSDRSGRKRGVVVHEGLDYFITCALWYTRI